MKWIALILIALVSCKKAEPRFKTLSWSTIGADSQSVKINNSEARSPVTLRHGDVVSCEFYAQPLSQNLSVSLYINGEIFGSCSGCYIYIRTFIVE